LFGNGCNNYQRRVAFIVNRNVAQAVKGVEFVSDRLSQIVLEGLMIVYRMYLPQLNINVNTKEEYYLSNYVTCLWLSQYHMRKIVDDFNGT
jgi:hypothetical protein